MDAAQELAAIRSICVEAGWHEDQQRLMDFIEGHVRFPGQIVGMANGFSLSMRLGPLVGLRRALSSRFEELAMRRSKRDKPFVKARELAVLLNLPLSMIREDVARGKLPAIHRGGQHFLDVVVATDFYRKLAGA